jgi:putative NADH-flavin reductase
VKLFILGGTGRTGRALLEQAVARGHEVTALVRSPEKVSLRNTLLQIVQGNPHDAAQMVGALHDCDAVISVLGTHTLKPHSLVMDCARSTIEAMRRQQIQRLLIVSSSLLFPHVGLIGSFFRHFILHNAMRDSREMERIVTESGLDWTIIRPTRLTDGQGTEHFNAQPNRFVRGRGFIPRSDLAHCLIEIAEKGTYTRMVVGLTT